MNDGMFLGPMEVQFTEPADIARFGDGWFRYDEKAIVRMPAHALVDIERELDVTLVHVMNEFRRSSVLGDLAGAWLAVRATSVDLAGKFEDFTPAILLARWRQDEEGKAVGTAITSDPEEKATLTDTVILQTLPTSV